MLNRVKVYQDVVEELIRNYSFPNQPANLYEPLRYFLNLGGKRMRPVLALMSAEIFSRDHKLAEQAALSIELFHNFTLIHDDIMDQAPLRRGQETVHIRWNENIAILCGDVLFVEAYKCLSSYKAETLSEIFPLFNKTAEEVCQGQQLDMDFENATQTTIEDYIEMIRLKTAVLLGCSLKMGGIIGGATTKDADDLYNFGVNLGIAFQLQDDILDVYGDKSKFGKQVGGDIAANKKTFLLLEAYTLADHSQRERLDKLKSSTHLDEKVKGVMELYSELNIKKLAEDKMNYYYSKAMDNLDHIQVNAEQKAPLRDLANFLMNRES